MRPASRARTVPKSERSREAECGFVRAPHRAAQCAAQALARDDCGSEEQNKGGERYRCGPWQRVLQPPEIRKAGDRGAGKMHDAVAAFSLGGGAGTVVAIEAEHGHVEMPRRAFGLPADARVETRLVGADHQNAAAIPSHRALMPQDREQP